MGDILFSQTGNALDCRQWQGRRRAPTLAVPSGGGLDPRSPWLSGAAGKPAKPPGDRTALRMIDHRNQESQVFWGPKEPPAPHLLGERPMRRLVAGDPHASLGPTAESRRSPAKLRPNRTQRDLLGQSGGTLAAAPATPAGQRPGES